MANTGPGIPAFADSCLGHSAGLDQAMSKLLLLNQTCWLTHPNHEQCPCDEAQDMHRCCRVPKVQPAYASSGPAAMHNPPCATPGWTIRQFDGSFGSKSCYRHKVATVELLFGVQRTVKSDAKPAGCTRVDSRCVQGLSMPDHQHVSLSLIHISSPRDATLSRMPSSA